ncbi:MAG TPA: MBL fold metallo-hydrolase [Candidatus Limnocylindrales bacterium]|nr:MBL fold metallo-hydrolase [Candidatus Limnocylindrales bacterium]
MDLHFLGGATTVTGSRFLLTTERASVLVDCGIFQGSPNESIRNRIPLGFDAAALDAILLTHAHLDHCGLLPIAVREGFAGPIWATSATGELATLVLLDSGRLHEEFAKREHRWEARNPEKAIVEDRERAEVYLGALEDARRTHDAEAADRGPGTPAARPPGDEVAEDESLAFAVGSVGTGEHVATAIEPDGGWATRPIQDPEADLRAQGPELLIDLDAPLYTEKEAGAVVPLFRTARYEREFEVAPGVHATFVDAGHILGSAIIRLRVRDRDDSPERVIVFSGDLGRPNTPILRDPTVLEAADYVVIESTYGGREHEPTEEAIRTLAEAVREVDRVGGVLLVPSFAIGRTQEIVYELDRLIERGEIPLLPLYLDSPMASKASGIYRRHPEMYDEATAKLLASGDTPLDYPDQRITNDVRDSKAIARSPRPYMIVASNGMLTGGRVVAHLRELIDDPKATLLFVGYQGQGTLGSHLQAGAETVKLDGQVRHVRCRVVSIDGFSAHADESELLDWLGKFGAGRKPGDAGYPRRVFLVHGDPDAQLALEPKVRALGFDAHVPKWHERAVLD